jgi:hypothetical protein
MAVYLYCAAPQRDKVLLKDTLGIALKDLLGLEVGNYSTSNCSKCGTPLTLEHNLFGSDKVVKYFLSKSLDLLFLEMHGKLLWLAFYLIEAKMQTLTRAKIDHNGVGCYY